MSQYGLVEQGPVERGALVPRVPSDQVRLDVAFIGAASQGVDDGP